MEIKFKISTDEIKRAKRELEAYRDGLRDKCEQFVDHLVSVGISVATMSVSDDYAPYITFSKTVNSTLFGAEAILYATSGTITRQWLTFDGKIREAEISPLLMAEYGSGFFASDAAGLENAEMAKMVGAGQGTFPGQTHAFDEEGWYWMDLSGEWHSSRGEEPTLPVFNALITMENEIVEIARMYFK